MLNVPRPTLQREARATSRSKAYASSPKHYRTNTRHPVLPRFSSRTPHISIRGPSPYSVSTSPIPSRHHPPRRRRIVLLLLIVIILLFGSRNFSTLRSLIPFIPQPKTFTEPHPRRSDLKFELSYVSPRPPTVRFTVTNLHPTTLMTVLSWGTPFDDNLFSSGVLSVNDTASGMSLLPMQNSRVDRNTAPRREDMIDLGPLRAVTKDVPLVSEEWKLERGRLYDIRVKGVWKVVWHASVEDIGERALKLGAGPTGVVGWDFEEVLRVEGG